MCKRKEERTLTDITEDTYSNEWTTHFSAKNGVVEMFRDKDGHTFYTEQYKNEYGEVSFPEGFEKMLHGKTLEEQMDCFYIVKSSSYQTFSYGDLDKDKQLRKAIRLQDYPRIQKLIVKGRLLVGVRIQGWWASSVVLPFKCVCTYYGSDNEGSGTKECEEYAYLFCKEAN